LCAQSQDEESDLLVQEVRTPGLVPWKKNYFALTWNPGLPEQTPSPSDGANQEQEVNFQLSLRSLVWQPTQDFSFHVGYTGKSA